MSSPARLTLGAVFTGHTTRETHLAFATRRRYLLDAWLRHYEVWGSPDAEWSAAIMACNDAAADLGLTYHEEATRYE